MVPVQACPACIPGGGSGPSGGGVTFMGVVATILAVVVIAGIVNWLFELGDRADARAQKRRRAAERAEYERKKGQQ